MGSAPSPAPARGRVGERVPPVGSKDTPAQKAGGQGAASTGQARDNAPEPVRDRTFPQIRGSNGPRGPRAGDGDARSEPGPCPGPAGGSGYGQANMGNLARRGPNASGHKETNVDRTQKRDFVAGLHEASGGGLNDDYRRPEFYASPKSRSSIKHWQGARFFVEWNPVVQRRRLAAT